MEIQLVLDCQIESTASQTKLIHQAVVEETDLSHLIVVHAQDILHQVVGLTDQLHVSVLDAVVDHLHKVAGALVSHPVTAGLPGSDLGRDALEDVLDVWPA